MAAANTTAKSPKRMLFQWTAEHADSAGLNRMVECIKRYQKNFRLSGGVKVDASIRTSAVALDQLFQWESRSKALFDLLLASLYEADRREFEEYLKEAKDMLASGRPDVEVIVFMRNFQKRLVNREFAWMAYVWAEGEIDWEDESSVIKWFMFCTHRIPNVYRGNAELTNEQISAIYVKAVKPSDIDPKQNGKKDWLVEMFRKDTEKAAEKAAEKPAAKPAEATAAAKSAKISKTASKKSARGIAGAAAAVKDKAAEEKKTGSEKKVDVRMTVIDPVIRAEAKKVAEQQSATVFDKAADYLQGQKADAAVSASPAPAPAERKTLTVKANAEPYKPKAAATVFDVRNRMTALAMPSPGYTRYYGYVRRFSGFMNFYVVGEFLSGGYLQDAGPELYARMFPSHGGITLRTSRRPNIPDGAFMTVDLQPSDLDDNIDWTTKQKRTDFTKFADFDALMRANRIRPAAESLCYIAVYPDPDRAAQVDLEKNIPVTTSLCGGENALEPRLINLPVVLAHEGYFYGPTTLREDSAHNVYVNLQTTATAGLVHAWSMAGSRTVHANVFSCVDENGVARKAVDTVCMRSLREVVRDVASDATLLKKLTSVVSADRSERDRVAEWIEKSVEAPSLFTEDDRVREARCARIQNMLAADARNDRFISTAAKLLSNALDAEGDGPDDAMVNRVVEQVAADPKILRKLESHRLIRARMEELRADCERMQTELDDLTKRHREEEARFKAEVEGKNRQLIADNAKLEKSLEEKQKTLGTLDACADDIAMRNRLAAEMKELEARRDELTGQVEGIGDLLKKSVRDCRSVAFSGALASKFREAAAEWESGVETAAFAERFTAVKALEPAKLEGKALADYLVSAVGAERAYSRNEILNLFICATQSFLTILSGAPGCGKTSACHLMGRVLGLADPAAALTGGSSVAADDLVRFLPVAVGRGWTSRRDLLGYWNPLSKTFESPDPRRWEALRELDAEARAGWTGLPFVMLLDEANLSAMEHYWADFMTMADECRTGATVSLGEGMLYRIPETLRFLATINSDHTVEALSPRLIDRATIVTLPELPCEGLMSDEPVSSTADPKLVSWPAMKALFGARPIRSRRSEVEDLLVGLYERFVKAGMPLSPRTRRAAEGYVSAAAAVFESTDRPAHIQAVDFAVAQKLLPRISGTGDEFRAALVEIRNALENSALEKSCAMADDIIRRGDDAMGYWRFF